MSRLDEFESTLWEMTTELSEMRPFVCNGTPVECDVFIVGCNPATVTDTDFWTYWRVERGFDKRTRLADYKAQRRNAGSAKSGRKVARGSYSAVWQAPSVAKARRAAGNRAKNCFG